MPGCPAAQRFGAGEADEGVTAEPLRLDESQRYREASRDASHGTLTAPFTGKHGWYWQNDSSRSVTITLTTAGYYRVIGQL